jgi:hypothetical protein
LQEQNREARFIVAPDTKPDSHTVGKEVAMADNKSNPSSSVKSTLNEAPLESWKEIATYLGRDVSTVRRWQKLEQLPVHHYLHQAPSSVYAYPAGAHR